MLFRSKTQLAEAIEAAEREMGTIPEVAKLLAFIRSSKRGVIR
jgi:acyl-[acyl carrier protein]--UDP-N-acetylglucosamine O-acyltransferase